MTLAVNIAQIGSNNTTFRNRIINGAMVIDQRNAGAEVNPAVTATYYLDRWIASSTVASKYKIGQNAGAVTPPVGYTNYLGCTSLSAYTAGASEAFNIQQRIEGFNVADLAWGTASAATVTLSFQVYSSLTGTFGGSLRNSATNRSYPFSYSIAVANTWTQISIPIAGDTAGTWLTNNGIGIFVTFSLGAGATLSGTAGSWAGANYVQPTGATSVVGTSGATFYITGVQLEAGSTASPFEYRSYGTELALCQRYFVRIIGTASNPTIGVGTQPSTTTVAGQIPLLVTMRSTTAIITGGVSASDSFGYNQGVTLSTSEAVNNCLYITGTLPGAYGAQGRPVLFVLNGTSSAIGIATEL
jgi:hypothetical protein